MVSALDAARQIVAAGGTGALVTVLSGPHRWERLVVDGDGRAISDPGGVIDDGGTAVLTGVIGREATGVVQLGDTEVFVEVIGPGPTLVICGAGPIAEALSAMATRTGFTVDVIDPRQAFVRPERFPKARSVQQGWPDQVLALHALDARTYVVSLLHEARFEADLFPLLLRSSIRYIGALGSRRTHAVRLDRLRSEGFTEADLERIHGPVGIDIGAEAPEEIAVSILAEMVATRRGSDLKARADRSRVI
jgi:xanthine dehydrogenase accessory factor